MCPGVTLVSGMHVCMAVIKMIISHIPYVSGFEKRDNFTQTPNFGKLSPFQSSEGLWRYSCLKL